MRLVFRQRPDAEHGWDFAQLFHDDADGEDDERLRSLGPGELVVVALDKKVLDEADPADKKNPLVRRVRISAPARGRLKET